MTVKELRLKTDPLDDFNVHFSCVILVDHISTNFSTNFLCINTLTSMLQQTSFNHSRLSEFVFTYMTAIILNILDDVLSCASSAFLVIIKKNVHRSQSNLLKTTQCIVFMCNLSRLYFLQTSLHVSYAFRKSSALSNKCFLTSAGCLNLFSH